MRYGGRLNGPQIDGASLGGPAGPRPRALRPPYAGKRDSGAASKARPDSSIVY